MEKSKAKAASKPKKTSGTGKPARIKKVTTMNTEPREEEIREKAKEIYHERIARGLDGTAEEDWLNAEQKLRGIKR